MHGQYNRRANEYQQLTGYQLGKYNMVVKYHYYKDKIFYFPYSTLHTFQTAVKSSLSHHSLFSVYLLYSSLYTHFTLLRILTLLFSVYLLYSSRYTYFTLLCILTLLFSVCLLYSSLYTHFTLLGILTLLFSVQLLDIAEVVHYYLKK